jgi:hypothetical protein
MKAKIALATVSGRAYYKLVIELKRKGLPFLSLKPWDPIPLDIKVVITTKEERHLVAHPNVLIFEYESNPTSVIDEAVLGVQGKRSYEKVVVGVDPGKTYGVAVLGDDNVLETLNCSGSKKAVNVILDDLNRFPATVSVVKVGDGAPAYTKGLLPSLDETLPQETVIEVVSEAGTRKKIKPSVCNREYLFFLS